MSTFSSVIKSAGVQLEQAAYKKFGEAVQGIAAGALGKIFGGKSGSKLSQTDPNSATEAVRRAQIGVWDATKYAAAIASGAGNLQPKTKFLFKIKFQVYPEVLSIVQELDPSLGDIARDLSFTIKQVDLPSLQYNYEEVNMYNFRTKVLKSIDYRDMDLTFYDDVSNNAINFINIYMMLLKPITRQVPSTGFALSNSGFAFAQNYRSIDTSYRGSFFGDAKNRHDILSSMVIEQFYLRVSQNGLDPIRVNTFTFTNPRISNMDINDLDHEMGSSPNTITATINFDAIHIETGNNGVKTKTPSLPGRDILDGTEESAAYVKRSPPMQEGKARNPFVDILARQGQRAVQVGIANALNKKFGTIAGGALAGAIGTIAGGLGEAAGRTLKSVSDGIIQNIALPSIPFISKDSNTSSSQTNAGREPTGI